MTDRTPNDKLIMERLGTDPSGWARTETNQTCDFLMSVAGALGESGQVATRHVDALRMDLAGIQSQPQSSTRQDPPLLVLSRSGCEFIKLLEARYGRDRLVMNLFRHNIRAWSRDICVILNRWGQTTLKNSEKVLNRSIVIYRPGLEAGDERLFSSLIVDMAEKIDTCVEAIQSAAGRVESWHCDSFATKEDDSTDRLVAERLGMRGLAHETSPGQEEEYFVRRIALELAHLAQFTNHFTTQVTTNLDLPTNVLLEMRAKWLQTEANRLFNFSWPSSPGIVAMEVARNQVMMILAGMIEALLDIEQESTGLFPGRMGANIAPRQRQRVEAVRGNLVADAMVAGLSARDAADSVIALLAYAEKHELSASEIIISELAKIHPALMPRTLQKFQEFTAHDPLSQSRSAEKSRGAGKSMQLLARFTERAQRLPALAILMIGLMAGGCGLKTTPKSDVDDLRPEIPFRTNP